MSGNPYLQCPADEPLDSFFKSMVQAPGLADGVHGLFPAIPGLDLPFDAWNAPPAGKAGYESALLPLGDGLGGPLLSQGALQDLQDMQPLNNSSPSSKDEVSVQDRERDETQKLREREKAQRSKNAKNQKLFRQRAKEKSRATEEQLRRLEQQVASLCKDKDTLRERNIILEAALSSPSMQQQAYAQRVQQQRICAAEGALNLGFAASALLPNRERAMEPLQLHLICTPPRHFSVEELQALSFAEFVLIWKESISVMATLLLAENAPDFNMRTAAVVKEFGGLCGRLTALSPRLMHAFHVQPLEPHTGPTRLTVQELRTILVSLNLSNEQERSLLSQRAIVKFGMARVNGERAQLHADMKVVQGLPGANDPRLLFRLLELSEAFSLNVASQHTLFCNLMHACWDQILQPVQAAKFMVAAYPHCPDMAALLETLAMTQSAVDAQPHLAEALRLA